MKIVILDSYAANPGDLSWDDFKKLGELIAYDRTPQELVVKRCQDADIIISNKAVLDAETLKQLPKLKYIGMLSTGYNVVDTAAAAELGITVCNVPTYSSSAVAQMTFALILEICNRVSLHSESVHNGEWCSCPDFCFTKAPLTELYGKTIGIIGYGKIGAETAKIADAFNMNILCFTPHTKPQPNLKSFKFVSLDELAANSDIVTLHCPLTPQTEKMINADFIAKMKNGAIIINTSRGQSVDEAALADALNSGKLSAAGLDVLACEPPKPDNPLLKCKNCFITPHISWASTETRHRLLGIVLDNLKAFLDGNPQNKVN